MCVDNGLTNAAANEIVTYSIFLMMHLSLYLYLQPDALKAIIGRLLDQSLQVTLSKIP